mmetsp:Transcript_3578/g.11264  ORF Transcript_3578/g.11264 Transcript_3578/m.11264 type:complete len:339 (-) Transcript_3578:1463-2479(-)
MLDAVPVHVVEPKGRGKRRTGVLRNLLPTNDEAADHLVQGLAALRRWDHAGAEDVLLLHLLRGALLVQEVEDAQAGGPKLVTDELRGRRGVQQAPRARPLHAPLHHLVVLRPPHRLRGHVGELAHHLWLGQAHVFGAGFGARARDRAPEPLALVRAFRDHDLGALAGVQDLLAHEAVLVRREEIQDLAQLLALAVRIAAWLVEPQLLHLGLDVKELHEIHVYTPLRLPTRRIIPLQRGLRPHSREQRREHLRGVTVHALGHDPAEQVLPDAEVEVAPVIAVDDLSLPRAVAPRLLLGLLLLLLLLLLPLLLLLLAESLSESSSAFGLPMSVSLSSSKK